jgi:hypothetical protein
VSEEVICGDHRLVFEASDTAHLLLRGNVSAEQGAVIMGALVSWAGSRAVIFVLINLSNLSGIAAEARRTAVVESMRLPRRAVAVYGGSFGVRIALDMIIRASALLRRTPQTVFYAPSEAAARAWFDRARERLAGAP